MFTHFVFWLWFAGVIYLAGGFVAVWHMLAAARGLDKLIVLGPTLVAAPLAVFGAEHFVDARDIMQMVPSWIPAHLFWTYFVGCSLFAAATSLVTMKFMRLAATLLGTMFFVFVFTMDIPGVIAEPHNRIFWALMLRESAFAAGAWALAGSVGRESATDGSKVAGSKIDDAKVLIGRAVVGLTVTFYGLEQLLHPEFVLGVPLEKPTPTWIPLHAFLGYPVGAFMLAAGIVCLFNQRPRTAAAWTGALLTLITVAFYGPILAVTHDPAQLTEAINYVFDTMLFAGTVLLVARALPASRSHQES
jgi:uncharacterized membrane protein